MLRLPLGVGREIPVKYFFGIALVVAAVMAGWEILAPEVTNIVFQDELHDMAAQAGAHIGLVVPPSDGVLRNLVIRKAEKHEVTLDPAQVTVRRRAGEPRALHRGGLYGARESGRLFVRQTLPPHELWRKVLIPAVTWGHCAIVTVSGPCA